MSRFFTEVQFEVPKDPDLPKTTTTTWDKGKIAQADEAIKVEVAALQSGTSKYSAYAVEPGKFGFPAMNALAKFVQTPNDKTLKNFEDSANSTFGERAGRAFADMLRACMETREV